MNAVTEYLSECGRLLKWVFFQPSKLRAHIRQIAPDVADKTGFNSLRQAWRIAEFRRLVIQALLVIVVLPFALDALFGLTVTAFGGHFNWVRSFGNVSLFVAFGVAVGVAVGVAFGVVGGITFGVVGGITFGVWSVVAFKGWVADSRLVFNGISFGFGLIFASTRGSLASRVGIGLPATIVVGIALSLTVGLTVGITVGVALFWYTTKFQFYIFEIWPAIKTYRRSLTSHSAADEFLKSPVGYDEGMVWPQPYLSSFLIRVYGQNLNKALPLMGKVSCMPFQRWAAQKALRTLLEDKQISFFSNLNCILTSPEPYILFDFDSNKGNWESDKYFSAKLLLGELMGQWPKVPRSYNLYWPRDLVPRAMTFWLRKRGVSPYAELAKVYFHLLHKTPLILKEISGRDGDKLYTYFWSVIPGAVEVLNDSRHLPDGEEFYQSWRLAEISLRCKNLQQISKLRDEFTPLFELEQPLRPQIVTVFRRLRDAAVDASSFLTAAHEWTRKDALLKAGGVLEEARQLANEVYEPERSLLLAVIEHWRRMFAIEGGRVAQQQEVEILPNPYVAGRPIRPEDGQLFVGRREEMKLIEEKLQTGVGIVIYGQRRIGKTSILLHLRHRLPHDLLPVYLNLQILMANSTGGFLYAVAREIAKQIGAEPRAVATGSTAGTQVEPTGALPLPVPYLPSAEEFTREPYLSFNHLLEQIEARLQPGQRVLLSFDEFEELEQRVKSGKIEPEIFAYLRGVTQTGSRFALLFAGLHTLEQMTREYWNPFFASVQTIRVGYLSELDAEQLIRDPIEQFPLSYELEAVNRITELTSSHPYLTQSLCHNLVNRLNDPLNRSNKAKQEDVDAVIERTLDSSGYYFDDFVWGWSGEAERMALSLLAEVEGEAAFSIIKKHLGQEVALTATRNLVARDILSERTSEFGELVFRFQIPLAQMWVKQKKPSARILMEGGKL